MNVKKAGQAPRGTSLIHHWIKEDNDMSPLSIYSQVFSEMMFQ